MFWETELYFPNLLAVVGLTKALAEIISHFYNVLASFEKGKDLVSSAMKF